MKMITILMRNMKITIFEILNLRFQFQENARRLKLPPKVLEGDITSVEWFVKNGYKYNRFKPNYNETLEIANNILKHA